MTHFDVDFVVLWVDPNDPQWQADKAKYNPKTTEDDRAVRYQDWDNFKYWFRAVAKYAPWVRKIHLVTCGQVPQWLNTEHPKIHLVKHSDYMPADALPTFNSSAIEVGIQNTPELAECFVYFNDDVFLTAFVDRTYFFENGVPVDMPGLNVSPKKVTGDLFSYLLWNNSMVIRKHFSRNELFKGRLLQWLNPAYGKTFLRTLRYIGYSDFPGFVMPHLSVPYRKSDFEKVWAQEESVLRNTQYHRFRNEADVTHFLIRNWRMCDGAFAPGKSRGKYFSLADENAALAAAKAIKNQKYPEICINEQCTGEEFERVKAVINGAFAETLKDLCEFEKKG